MTYFKATRPDGTDFYSGLILYKIGKRVRPAEASLTPAICGPGYLHASDAPGEVLVGGRWPCRLFEVTGKPAAGFDGEHKHKGGFKQLTVVREIDPYLALGPNGRYVAGIIERIRKADRGEIEKLRAARGAVRGAAWEAVRGAAWGAARGAARGAVREASWGASREAAREAAWEAARGAAWEAAWEAVLALGVRDLITPEQFDSLYSPWQSVMGKPKMAPKWKGPK